MLSDCRASCCHWNNIDNSQEQDELTLRHNTDRYFEPTDQGTSNAPVPIMVVGNKCDEQQSREIPKELATKLVLELMPNCGHVETSAKTDYNVQQVFQVSCCGCCC